MNVDKLLDELESKNNEICQFLRRTLEMSNININNSTFDLLSKKLLNHDKIIVNAMVESNKNLEKMIMSIVNHIN